MSTFHAMVTYVVENWVAFLAMAFAFLPAKLYKRRSPLGMGLFTLIVGVVSIFAARESAPLDSLKENLRRSLPRHSFSATANNNTEAPSMRF